VAEVIGQALTRKRKAHDGWDAVRVVGHQGNAFVIAATEDFRPPKLASEGSLATEYGAAIDSLESHEARLIRLDAEATAQAARDNQPWSHDTSATPAHDSPEGIFAAQAAAEAADAD